MQELMNKLSYNNRMLVDFIHLIQLEYEFPLLLKYLGIRLVQDNNVIILPQYPVRLI